MKTNFSLLFYLKKPKNYVKGAVPVYLRITVDGKPVEMSASRKCEPDLWNTKAGHMIGTKEDAKTLNSYLDKMKAGQFKFSRIEDLMISQRAYLFFLSHEIAALTF